MEHIKFTVDENLSDINLDFLKDNFKKLAVFTLKNVGTLIGTKKVYSKEIIKVMTDGTNSFRTKVIFNKLKFDDLSIEIYCISPNGIEVITLKNKYKVSNEEIISDIQYIIDNLEKIKG